MNSSFERLSKTTGVPVWEFKKALEIPLPEPQKAGTLLEAEAVWRQSVAIGREEQQAALEQWERVAQDTLNRASTRAEVEFVYDNSPRGVAQDEAYLKLVSMCTSENEILGLFTQRFKPAGVLRDDLQNREGLAVLRKMVELSS